MKLIFSTVLLCVFSIAAHANPATPSKAVAPDLDLRITYYNKVETAEGVLREARYSETMLRRPQHVWVERELPKWAEQEEATAHIKKVANNDTAAREEAHQHKHFNHIALARHIILNDKLPRIEFIDHHTKEVIAIPPAEFGNVNFDGSWANSYYLLDPKFVETLPRSNRPTKVPHTEWRSIEKNGNFQRVLWDQARQIPLLIESGDLAGRFYQRVEIQPATTLRTNLPWQGIQKYAQREYSDFLD